MRFVTLLAAVTCAVPLAAQEAEPERPSNWEVRFDRPGTSDSSLYYVTMEPGWHVRTGPAAILYDPARTAQGTFTVESEIYLFPVRRLREAFGIFIGGKDLQGAEQAYVYFLIRGDGQFIIKRRAGPRAETLVPWTRHDAVLAHDGGDGTAKNVLRIVVGATTVQFLVNGDEVASVPRDELDCDGIIGLRVNHALDLHVSSLDVTQG